MKAVAIIPSAGMGTRMGSKRKNYMKLLGAPVLAHTLAAFEAAKGVESVILVAPAADIEFCRKNIVKKYRLKKVLKIIAGGKERQDSVARGLAAIVKDGLTPDIVVVHDGARPLVTPEIIEAAIEAAKMYGGAATAVPVKDTIKSLVPSSKIRTPLFRGTRAKGRGSEGPGEIRFIKKTVPRENLWAVQTPQAFKTPILMKAHAAAAKSGYLGTDESSLVERLGKGSRVALVPGLYENIKITTPEDLITAKGFLEERARSKRRDRKLRE